MYQAGEKVPVSVSVDIGSGRKSGSVLVSRKLPDGRGIDIDDLIKGAGLCSAGTAEG